MRKVLLGFVPAVLFCTLTFANPIPTFNLTQGSISVTFLGPGIPIPVDFGFTGPNGVSVGGTGTISSASCLGFVLAGDVCNPGLGVIFPDSASVSGPGVPPAGLFSFNAGISGPNFTLPPPGNNSFTITLPVIFNTQLSACPVDPSNPQGGCTGIQSLALFNVTGKGTATLTFSGATSNFPVWFLTHATYTFNPVPEPSTLLLLGSGVAPLLAKFLSRRR